MSELNKTIDENFHKLMLELNFLRKYQSIIFRNPTTKEFDSSIRLRVQASVVAGIYSGFEKLMETFADHSESNIDRTKLDHSSYHKQLLDLTIPANPEWDDSTKRDLAEILRFRHFYRHNFASDLNPEKTGRIVELVLLVFPGLTDEFKMMFKKLDSESISKDANEKLETQTEKHGRLKFKSGE